MNRIPKGWISGIAFGLLLGTMVVAVAEDLTVTTYYPSPRGVYDELRARRLQVEDETLLAVTGGNVGIGTGTPGAKLHVVGTSTLGGNVTIAGTSIFNGAATVTGTSNLNNVVISGTLNPLGSPNLAIGVRTDGLQFVTPSDARFKRDIMPLTGTLEKLNQLHGVSFEWNHLMESLGYSPSGKRELGVIAQELETAFPELVVVSGDEQYRSVDYSKLTVVLLEAIKELRAEQERLKQQLMVLESQLSKE